MIEKIVKIIKEGEVRVSTGSHGKYIQDYLITTETGIKIYTGEGVWRKKDLANPEARFTGAPIEYFGGKNAEGQIIGKIDFRRSV